MINLLNLITNKEDTYQVNELVSRDHRENFDLNSIEERIYRALRSIFGAELDEVLIGDRFYAYKLKQRLGKVRISHMAREHLLVTH